MAPQKRYHVKVQGFLVRQDVHRQIVALAALRNQNMSVVVRLAIEHYLQHGLTADELAVISNHNEQESEPEKVTINET